MRQTPRISDVKHFHNRKQVQLLIEFRLLSFVGKKDIGQVVSNLEKHLVYGIKFVPAKLQRD